MEQWYHEGQRVKFVKIKGSDPSMDRLINAPMGKTGTIIKSYCVSKDEMPDLIKSVVYIDVYSYDVQVDNGEIERGIPQPALKLLE
jgi:hypothetical protein